MRVAVVGAGLMGSQIAAEYALGGHAVVVVARRPEAARTRLEETARLVAELGLAPAGVSAASVAEIDITTSVGAISGGVDLVVESVVERLDAKVEILGAAARRFPRAILASNTSSLRITAIGEGAGAPERTVGSHYWNPPLLMPLVEVVRGEGTAPEVVERMTATLRALGKRPVPVERDAPGFVWNRLQLALLREAVWLVEQGVATPATVDEVVRDGLARRWRYTGPFQTAALGGAETFERVAENLFPVLSTADRLEGLGRWLEASPDRLGAWRRRRDLGLLADRRRDRPGDGSETATDGPAGTGERPGGMGRW